MRENDALMALGVAHAGDQRGTPAGNSGLTQEQLAVLRERGLGIEHIVCFPVLVAARPPCPGAIPDEHRAQAEMVLMQCPVMGEQLMAPGLKRPMFLLPDGRIGVPLE